MPFKIDSTQSKRSPNLKGSLPADANQKTDNKQELLVVSRNLPSHFAIG